MAAVLTYVSTANSTADSNTYTFTAQAIGTAAADRIVIVGAFGGSNSPAAITGITVQGITGVQSGHADNTGNNVSLAIWAIAVPTGTTGDIVVTIGGTKGRCGIIVWNATGTNITATDTQHQEQNSGGGATSLSITPVVQAGGFFVTLVGTGTTNDAGGFNWTNATERVDVNIESNSYMSGADGTVGALVTAATVNASQPGMDILSASFAPASTAKLFRRNPMAGLGVGGPFFADPLAC